MKKTFIGLFAVLFGLSNAQIVTNNEDIKDKVSIFEVWSFKKFSSNKESYFIDYGQKNFKPNNYDLNDQGIFDSENIKFEKGEWVRLVNYLDSQGFYKVDERIENIGYSKGRITTFKKIEN